MHPRIQGRHAHKQTGVEFDYDAVVHIEGPLWNWIAAVTRAGRGGRIEHTGTVEFEAPPSRDTGFQTVRRAIARAIDGREAG